MYRVVLPATVIMLLTGCSLGPSPLSFGFSDASNVANPLSTASARRSSTPSSQGLGGDTSTSHVASLDSASKKRTAALADKAPSGSFEKAPPGALSDRDYAGTQLDPEKARDVINAYRREKGLKPLKLNAELTNAAKAHSKDLAKWDRISHYGSDGSNPWDRVKRNGYNARVAAENVGTGQTTIDEVFKGWKASASHNKNLLLADAEHMGIALVQDSKTEFKTFWTLVVGSPL